MPPHISAWKPHSQPRRLSGQGISSLGDAVAVGEIKLLWEYFA